MYPEFLDELLNVQPWSPGLKLEPWRDCAHDVFLLPVDLVLSFTEKAKLDYIVKHEMDLVRSIKTGVRNEGLREPLQMVIDREGRMILHDGHHRLLAVKNLLTEIPVVFKISDKINRKCKTVSMELPSILAALGNMGTTNR